MIIRGVSVFEGIVYHSYVVDPEHPCRPTLEVEAVVRDGDVDAGPLLVSLAEYATLAGGPDVVRPCLPRLREQGRIVDHLGVHVGNARYGTPIHLEQR